MISVNRVSRDNKLDKLINLLTKIDNETYREGTIIFVNENHTAEFLTSLVSETICPATCVHGSLLNWEVTYALQQYESREVAILIATSADRNVQCSHIINFDVPLRKGEYVQRIGRTNHIGNKPNVVTFFDQNVDTNTSMGVVFNQILKASEG